MTTCDDLSSYRSWPRFLTCCFLCHAQQVSIAGQPGGVEAARVKIRVSWDTRTTTTSDTRCTYSASCGNAGRHLIGGRPYRFSFNSLRPERSEIIFGRKCSFLVSRLPVSYSHSSALRPSSLKLHAILTQLFFCFERRHMGCFFFFFFHNLKQFPGVLIRFL